MYKSLKSVTVLKAKPGTTQKTVNINMKKCHEDISVYTVAADGGDSIGSSTISTVYSILNVFCFRFLAGHGRMPETASARRLLLILQLVEVFHFDVAQIAVNVDDDRYGDGRLGRGDRYGEQREEEAFELSGKEIAVEHGEIDIHRIEDQLDRNEHGDQVTPRDESVHAGEKHHGGQNQVIFHSYFHSSTSVYVRLTALRRCRPAAAR